jgi:hypothetical protein
MRVIYTSKGVMKILGCALSIEKYGNLARALLVAIVVILSLMKNFLDLNILMFNKY